MPLPIEGDGPYPMPRIDVSNDGEAEEINGIPSRAIAMFYAMACLAHEHIGVRLGGDQTFHELLIIPVLDGGFPT